MTPLGDTLEISVVASEVQSEPMEVEDASGQSDDMAKDTQTQGDEQTFVGRRTERDRRARIVYRKLII